MRLRPWLRLARAHSALGAGLLVWLGGRLAGAEWAWWWLLTMAVAFFLSAAGNAFNDAHDGVSDALNRPNRPIPRGEITPAQARWFAAACIAVAVGLAWPFGVVSRLGTLVGVLLLLLYTTHLKRVPVGGHAVVGLLTGMAMGYGGLLAGDVQAIIVPAAAVGLLFGARELLKTIHDLRGDQVQGTPTVATRWGPGAALSLATLLAGLAVLLFAWWNRLGWPSVVVALLGVAVLLPLWVPPLQPPRVAWSLRWSKGLGLAVLVLFAVG